MSKRVWRFRQNIKELGETPVVWVVTQYCKRNVERTCSEWLASLLKQFFRPPLDAGYGDELICLIPFMCINLTNSSKTNYGPLSETNCSERPYLVKVSVSLLIVFSEVVLDIVKTPGYLLWASTIIISSMCPLIGPA